MATRRGYLVVEPGDFFHGCGNAIRECLHLPLEGDEKGIQTRAANDLYGAVGDMGLVEIHGSP